MEASDSGKGCVRLRNYSPTLAAIVVSVLVLPGSEWVAQALTVNETADRDLQSQSYRFDDSTVRDEPIIPIPVLNNLDPRKIALGRSLFHEPGLSKTGEVSCASCHIIREGGDDNRQYSEGIRGAVGSINSPTVLNATLNFRQFWDGRAANLEEQIDGPVHSPTEMGSDWPSIVQHLQKHQVYSEWFQRTFDDGVTKENVIAAILEFEHSITTPNSDFDRWLKGDDLAITAQQKHGYHLFKEYQCIGCHQGVNVGGNLFQPLGVMQEYFDNGTESESDLGRFNVTGDERDKYVFKVPSLRNVARTSPYFHDGSAKQLPDAVRAMVVHQLGIKVDAQEIDAICAFLESLSANPSEVQP